MNAEEYVEEEEEEEKSNDENEDSIFSINLVNECKNTQILKEAISQISPVTEG